MLDEELAAHLGYEKHSPDGINTGNSRNVHIPEHTRSLSGSL